MSSSPPLIALMGPTASGKSEVAEQVADRLNLSLINADAFMVYKGLDIGTNKPLRKAEYSLIDIIEPTHEFGVGEYVLKAADQLKRYWDEDRGVVLVGGTGFYIRALLEQYRDLLPPPDPALRESLMNLQHSEGVEGLAKALWQASPDVAQKIDLKNPVRVRRALERIHDSRTPIQFSVPPFDIGKFVLDPPGGDERIVARTQLLLNSGWIEEVETLLNQNIAPEAPGFRAIGYDSVIGIAKGEITRSEAEQRIVTETRQYSRRQRTWLRAEPKVTRTFVSDDETDFSQACASEIVDYFLSRK